MFLHVVDVTTNHKTEARSHPTIPMEMLLDPIAFASTAPKTETAGGKMGSFGTMVVAFIEATTMAAVESRVAGTSLSELLRSGLWILASRIRMLWLSFCSTGRM